MAAIPARQANWSASSSPRQKSFAKGKAGKPIEFGKLVKLQEAENQIVIAYEVYDQRPNDKTCWFPGSAGSRRASGPYPETLEVVEFLHHLLRHIPGKLLVVWDGLKNHRSRLVWDFVREQRGPIWLEFLPAYPPELNPVEYLWGYLKQHELPNFCPENLGEPSHFGRKALRRIWRRPTLIMSFWEQAELFPL